MRSLIGHDSYDVPVVYQAMERRGLGVDRRRVKVNAISTQVVLRRHHNLCVKSRRNIRVAFYLAFLSNSTIIQFLRNDEK